MQTKPGINILIAVNIIVLLIAVIYFINTNNKIEKLRIENQALTISQNKNYAEIHKDEILTNIKKEVLKSPAPVGLIWAIRKHENGYPGHDYGMTKVFKGIGKERQLKSCIRVIQQEEVNFIKKYRKEFVKKLSVRYAPDEKEAREGWENSVYQIWQDYIKQENKK